MKNRKNTYPFAGNDVFPEGVDEKLTAEIIGVVADHFKEVSQYRYSLRQPLDFRTQFFAIPDSPEQIVIALKILNNPRLKARGFLTRCRLSRNRQGF